MKIVVFGATGKTGQKVVQQGLEGGHEITAFVRDPAKLEASHSNLHVVTGDVLDSVSIERALQSQEAALVALGAQSLGKTTVRSKGTERIVAAMKTSGLKRLMVTSSLGVHESWSQLRTYQKLFHKLFLRNVKAEHERQEDLVSASGLDWTIVRPGALTDGAKTGRYTYGTQRTIRAGRVARADVADFMLKEVSKSAFIHQVVTVT